MNGAPSIPAGAGPDGDALRQRIVEEARSLGFDRVGFARVAPLGPEAAALSRWLAEGMHASMDWMARHVEVRVAPDHERMLEGARTVVVLAASVLRRSEPDIGPSPGVVARYARGRDYHNVLGKRAQKLAQMLRTEGHAARATVDTAPILERAWAQRAGVGFIGKNAMLIVPGLGSHVLLATVVTSAVLPADPPMESRCGGCTRCLDACPTRAIVADRVVDARRCVSYLTIEHEGPVDEDLREGIGGWFFGCDACQDVCPFNRGLAPEGRLASAWEPRPWWQEHDAAAFLTMPAERFDAISVGSPVRRAGHEGARRNAAIVLGNRGDRRHLPVLREVASRDASETVRDAARWAAERIERRQSA